MRKNVRSAGPACRTACSARQRTRRHPERRIDRYPAEVPLAGERWDFYSGSLGWGVRDSLDGINGRFLTHGGSNGYWDARIVLAPDQESGLLIVTSSASDGAQKAIAAVEAEIVPTLIR